MIITVPDSKKPSMSQFGLVSMSTMEDNPFNPRVEVYEGDEYWAGEIAYSNLDKAQERDQRTFIHKLRGTSNEFFFEDIVHKQNGDWAGNLTVDGANQDGIELSIKGATADALIAPAGDRFQLGDHLYELVEDAVADSTGRCVLQFLPDIRVIADNNAPLITDNPRCKCMLMPKQTPPQGTTKRALLSEFKYTFRESLR